MFWIGFIAGTVVGVVFHAGLKKFFDNAKAKAKEAIDKADEHL